MRKYLAHLVHYLSGFTIGEDDVEGTDALRFMAVNCGQNMSLKTTALNRMKNDYYESVNYTFTH